MRRTLFAAGLAVTALMVTTTATAEAVTAQPNIIGGTQAPAGAWQFEGSLQLTAHGDPNWHTCGVTLIDPWHAETNAHCVTNEPRSGPAAAAAETRFQSWLSATAGDPPIDRTDPSIYRIRFGSTDRLHGGVVRHVTRIQTHQAWQWGVPNAKGEIGDIAKLTFDKPVWTVWPALIGPVRTNQTATAIGWGMNADPATWKGPAPEFLRQIELPVVDAHQCDPLGIGVGELCLGMSPQGGRQCFGDSGSGVFQQLHGWWRVIGSASRVMTATCGGPDVDTDLSYYRSWLYHDEPTDPDDSGRRLTGTPIH